MKRVNIILSACGLVILAYSLPSWAQVRQQTQTTTLSGTVESIDQSQRIMHIKPMTASLKRLTCQKPQSVSMNLRSGTRWR